MQWARYSISKYSILSFNKSGLFSCPAICHAVILSLCHSVCPALCISSFLSDWRFDILLTFWKTFVLITKLKSLSVFLSVCLSVRLSFYLSDILLTFWTTFVLITKLKSRFVFYLSFCLSVRLSVFQTVCRPVFLPFWHPVNILNKFCFDN